MFVIKQEQLDAFERRGVRELEEKIAGHVRAFFPRQAAEMDAETLRSCVADAVQRALGRGLEIEPDICVYADLVIVFGAGFEDDARYPWAQVLVDGSPGSPGDRVHVAMEGAIAYLRDPAPTPGEERPS
jgi:hypothetical protein